MSGGEEREERGGPSRRRVLAAASLALPLAACTGQGSRSPATSSSEGTPAPTSSTPAPATSARPRLGTYGVSSGHPLASRAGMDVLRDGGNAVDAAIATAFADAVLQPASSGIGGGGAAIVVKGGATANYDYREVADASGKVPESGTGIPGFVAGMARLHEEHGTVAWPDLLAPAVALAEDGAPVSRYLADTIGAPLGRRVTRSLKHFQGAGGRPLAEGQRLVQRDLAATMRRLGAEGPDDFYRGALARQLVKVDGIDLRSLGAYRIQKGAPASGPFGDFTVLSGAPALPGAAIIQMLQIAEAAGIGDAEPGSAEFVDLQSKAWDVADRSVQTVLGDPDFVSVPVDRLTDPSENARLARSLPAQPTAGTKPYAGAPNTTHVSVVDADGTAVSMTNTITNYWGSGQYVAGFFLNDQIGRFDDIGSTDANQPEPGRRSVTWSAPSMLLDDRRRPVLVIGTPGGRYIPNTTAHVVTRWALHGQSLAQAVPADRFLLDDGRLQLETAALREAMTQRGYRVEVVPRARRVDFGSTQALDVDWDRRTISSHADPRRSAGYLTA